MEKQQPRYLEVVQDLRKSIMSGQIRQGEKLPSENECSRLYGISRQTVRHAIDVLEQEKLVVRVRGSGTYVGSQVPAASRQQSFNIGVISTYVDSYIFPPVLKGIAGVLAQEGYTTQVAFTENQVSREGEILEQMLSKGQIDGLIAEPARSSLPNPNLHFYQELKKRQIPVLFFNSSYPGLSFPCVSLDDRWTGKAAAEYLIQAGHKRIGGLFRCDDGQGALRYAGFLEAMKEAGLKPAGRHVVWMDTEAQEDMERWADYLFYRLEGCEALVCYNDEAAVSLAELCIKRGIRIPEDLSLISIDNSELCSLSDVKLTSFEHPKEALGRLAAEHMVRMIENPYFDGGHQFRTQVVERGSVKR